MRRLLPEQFLLSPCRVSLIGSLVSVMVSGSLVAKWCCGLFVILCCVCEEMLLPLPLRMGAVRRGNVEELRLSPTTLDLRVRGSLPTGVVHLVL